MTNRVWRALTPHGALALRAGHPRSALLGIDRCREWHVLLRLQGHDIGPQPLHFDRRRDHAAFVWIPGQPGPPPPQAAREILARLHALPLSGYRFSPAAMIRHYRENVDLPSDIAAASHRYEDASARLEEDAVLRLCHNDSVAKNWIRRDDGGLRLIDFEFAGDNDPAFDLATLSLDVDLGPLAPRVAAYRPIVDCLWLLYCLVLASVDPSKRGAAEAQAKRRRQRLGLSF